jgi:transglutaminase-like putative cysteine protease
MQRGHSRLSVTATSEVEVGSPKRPRQAPDVPWEEAAEVLCHDLDPEGLEARQFILDSPLCETAAEITRYATMSLRPGGLLLQSVAELSARIHCDFAYVPGFTSVTTPLSVVLEHRRGVCQDFAHLAIGSLGLTGPCLMPGDKLSFAPLLGEGIHA